MGPAARALDAALEWSVIGSFTRIGSALRRRLDHWASFDGRDLTGRVIVITGATSGIGTEAARALARMGATVEIVARDGAKAAAVCSALRQDTGNPHVGFVIADTGDLVALRAAAADLLRRHPKIDVLIHNAGALDDVRQTSAQGIELTVASQLVGPHLLTGLLLPALKAAAPARVLWVSSGGMYSEPLAVAALEMSPRDYNGTTAYARAKRAQVTLTELWAERLAADRVVVHAMHPGWADTPGVERSLTTFRRIFGPLLRTPAEGADTLVWLASDDGEPLSHTGRFWLDRRPRPIHRLESTRRSDTPAERARLWTWCANKSGLSPRAGSPRLRFSPELRLADSRLRLRHPLGRDRIDRCLLDERRQEAAQPPKEACARGQHDHADVLRDRVERLRREAVHRIRRPAELRQERTHVRLP
jgi:NAD(P)-dependent dehydrogenase (short-subunit alcohol dehydrogenase family)